MPLIITSGGKMKHFSVRQRELRIIAIDELKDLTHEQLKSEFGSLTLADAADQVTMDADKLVDSVK